MIEVYLREPEPARHDDYRYVANCAPGRIKSLVCIEAGSDSEPREALDRLYSGLKELGLVSSYEEMSVVDDAGLIGPEPVPPDYRPGRG